MRRSNPGFNWLMLLLSVGVSLAVSPISAASSTQDDGGVAEFLRTHPGYRGFVTPHPPYPLASRYHHEQGKLVVTVIFAKEGQVSAVKLVKSSGYPRLDSNTVNYIKARWRSTYGQRETFTVPLEYSVR